jgi:hypothetical protein
MFRNTSQACDKVWHTGLLYKLRLSLLLKYFLVLKSCFHSRHFLVNSETEYIELSPFNAGILQGKVKVSLRLAVSQYVLVSSSLWDLRPDTYWFWKLLSCLYRMPSLTRGRASHCQQYLSIAKFIYLYFIYLFIFFLHFICHTCFVYIQYIYKASVSSGSVQQIISTCSLRYNSSVTLERSYASPPPSSSPLYFIPRQSQSQSHITTDDQSASISWFRTHSGTCNQILLLVRRLMPEGCCLVFVGRLLWREVGSVFCQSQPVVICKNVHLVFTQFSDIYQIYTRSLSVLARYSRFCPTRYYYLTLPQQFRHLNSRTNYRRQV